MNRREAEKVLMNTALDNNFAMPGDVGFPLNQAFEAPKDRNQAETLRGYIAQMRQELANRLLDRLYMDGDTPSKVSVLELCMTCDADAILVVAELFEEEIHGQDVMMSRRRFVARGRITPNTSSRQSICKKTPTSLEPGTANLALCKTSSGYKSVDSVSTFDTLAFKPFVWASSVLRFFAKFPRACTLPSAGNTRVAVKR